MNIGFDIQQSKEIQGVYILTPTTFKDARGSIWTSFLQEDIEKLLPDNVHFKHDKFSVSKQNVLRGVHGDSKSWKLVACVHGEVQQVVVDMRPGSPTYKKWQSFIIGESSQKIILIPPNMGNAYYAISGKVVYHYKLAYKGDYIDADKQFLLSWNDESVNINWLADDPILSDRDAMKNAR